MFLVKSILRILVKLLLMPVVIALLVIKVILTLAMKAIELPLGLLIWAVFIGIILTVIKKEWEGLLLPSLIMAGIVVCMLGVVMIDNAIDSMIGWIQAI
jgi:hypothetical protein